MKELQQQSDALVSEAEVYYEKSWHVGGEEERELLRKAQEIRERVYELDAELDGYLEQGSTGV